MALTTKTALHLNGVMGVVRTFTAKASGAETGSGQTGSATIIGYGQQAAGIVTYAQQSAGIVGYGQQSVTLESP